ncbi:MAG: hypothetical protein ACI4UY_09515 [Kiritimatiellia bacterium]
MNAKMLLAIAGLAAMAQAGTPWRDDLWLGRGSFWTSRVGVIVENPTDVAWEGKTVTIPVAQLPFRSARVEELRLVDAQGTELEYGVWTKGATRLVKEGSLPADGVFVIPVCCEAKGQAAYEIYYGNKAAWGLADFWPERPGRFVNGGFEEVDAKEPIGWRASGVDALHRVAVVEEGAPEGRRCVKAEADEAAEPTWFSYTQSGIPVHPGEKIRLRVKLRGENVKKGYAGWYVHAGNSKKGDVLNKVFRGNCKTPLTPCR